DAVEQFVSWLREQSNQTIDAIGHRVVHGGPVHRAPEPITDALLADLKKLIPIDPDHLPQAVETIEACQRSFPGTLQFACFDTAFHRRMPRVATLYPLPR